jgi:REP element-mobilizing transposase RayT
MTIETILERPGHRALRRGRSSTPGQVYFLTTVTHGRTLIFGDWRLATRTCRLIGDPELWRDSKLLSWVLMPDHLHALIQLGNDEALERLIQRVKSVLAQEVNRQRGGFDPVWAPAFHDRALREQDDLKAFARYVIANPVRAGLVTRAGDYPFWDVVWLPLL